MLDSIMCCVHFCVLGGTFGSRIHAPCNRAYTWYMHVHNVHVGGGWYFVIGGTLCGRNYSMLCNWGYACACTCIYFVVEGIHVLLDREYTLFVP